MGRVHLLSLGCPKNLVDSEKILERLREKGLHYSADPDNSDVLLVNTCGFIESAKKESIAEILKLAEHKGRKKLIVFGCLAQRYGEELKQEIPEIDAIWGVGAEEEITAYISGFTFKGKEPLEKERLTDTPYAYLKIAEGCDRGCSYCAIPGIRGDYKSRDPETIVSEAEDLIASGKKELIIVAQDITSYGKEWKDFDLSRLISGIAGISGDFWIRLLYLYPSSITDRLLKTIAREDKVCNYIDMPLQHVNKKVLGLMGRGGSRTYYERLLAKIRSIIPEVAIRTTFIVGFPHETDEEFEEMERFIRKARFERLGVFTYSNEEGTSAAKLKPRVPMRTKKKRYDQIMKVQADISLAKNRELLGRRFTALVDEFEEGIAVARLRTQAPEVDGVVFLMDSWMTEGEFVEVEITEAYEYDLKGVVLR